nr:immunoglobulin light chain junction region [Macaca mulatta]
CQLYESLPFTF